MRVVRCRRGCAGPCSALPPQPQDQACRPVPADRRGGARSTDRAQGGAVAVHDPAIASLFVTCSLHCEALPVVDVCFVFTLAWFSVMDACHPLTAVYTEHTVYARSVIIHLVTSCTHLYAKLPNLHL